jgi:CubicO group peptidase (beta-lactamase class C family)
MLKRKLKNYWWISLLLLSACQQSPKDTTDSVAIASPFMQTNLADYDSLVAHMSIEEKLGQLVYYEQKGSPTEEMVQLVQHGLLGGIQFSDITPSEFITWRDSLKQISPYPIFISLHNTHSFHSAFKKGSEVPSKEAWRATGIDSLSNFPQRMLLQQINRLGVDFSSIFVDKKPHLALDEEELDLIKYCSKNRILPLIECSNLSSFVYPDSSEQQLSTLHQFETYKQAGLAGLCFNLSSFDEQPLIKTANFFRQHLDYGGLLIGRINLSHDILPSLKLDIDLIKTDIPPKVILEVLLSELNQGVFNTYWLDYKVARLLQAKYWNNDRPVDEPASSKAKTLPASLAGPIDTPKESGTSVDDYFYDPSWTYWNHTILSSSLVLAADPANKIPLEISPTRSYSVYHIGQSEVQPFNSIFTKYTSLQSWIAKDWETIKRLASKSSPNKTHLLVLHDYALDSTQARELIQWNDANNSIILVNLGQATNLALLDTSITVIQSYDVSAKTQQLVPQLLFGGIAAKGQLIASYNSSFCVGQGIKNTATRLAFGIPQEADIDPKSLVGIDAIVKSAIQKKAFPGAQVLVVKEGNVLYNKAFGYHTYAKKTRVTTDDLYDLASITKVSATTLMAMKKYEDKSYQLNDKLKHHLDMGKQSRLSSLTPSQLLTHRTGLQAHLPVVPYLLYRDKENADCSYYFCYQPSDSFPIQVADRFYFNAYYYDQIWDDLYQLKPRKTKFKYSDANFVLLQKMLESDANQSLDQFVDDHYYKKLGLRRTMFNPLAHIPKSNIVPTQKDERWRYQLLQGYVHDETAALMGGVAGHAGLFSNAEELAVIFQMLLNGGYYGEDQFLKASTIKKFTAAKYGNHRGLGFDKPKKESIKEGKFPRQATTQLYGHTGFTGGCVWTDPENELIYIFLSNRVYPNAKNKLIFKKRIRERVHQTIYNSFDSFSPSLPVLSGNIASSS